MSKTTLFLGDLAIFCEEHHIREVFASFGDIIEVKVMRNTDTYQHMSYGFLTFLDPLSAKCAMTEMNGYILCGRPLRIRWAIHRNKLIETSVIDMKLFVPSIHFTFITYQVDFIVTEASLRDLFSQYGTVIDVAIKKSTIHKEIPRQSGYGFIHFSTYPEGVTAALEAVKYVNGVTIDGVHYKSSISHNLSKLLMNNVDGSMGSMGSMIDTLPSSNEEILFDKEYHEYNDTQQNLTSTTSVSQHSQPNHEKNYDPVEQQESVEIDSLVKSTGEMNYNTSIYYHVPSENGNSPQTRATAVAAAVENLKMNTSTMSGRGGDAVNSVDNSMSYPSTVYRSTSDLYQQHCAYPWGYMTTTGGGSSSPTMTIRQDGNTGNYYEVSPTPSSLQYFFVHHNEDMNYHRPVQMQTRYASLHHTTMQQQRQQQQPYPSDLSQQHANVNQFTSINARASMNSMSSSNTESSVSSNRTNRD